MHARNRPGAEPIWRYVQAIWLASWLGKQDGYKPHAVHSPLSSSPAPAACPHRHLARCPPDLRFVMANVLALHPSHYLLPISNMPPVNPSHCAHLRTTRPEMPPQTTSDGAGMLRRLLCKLLSNGSSYRLMTSAAFMSATAATVRPAAGSCVRSWRCVRSRRVRCCCTRSRCTGSWGLV